MTKLSLTIKLIYNTNFIFLTHNESLLLIIFFYNYNSPDKLSSFASKIDLVSSLSLKLLNILLSYFQSLLNYIDLLSYPRKLCLVIASSKASGSAFSIRVSESSDLHSTFLFALFALIASADAASRLLINGISEVLTWSSTLSSASTAAIAESLLASASKVFICTFK